MSTTIENGQLVMTADSLSNKGGIYKLPSNLPKWPAVDTMIFCFKAMINFPPTVPESVENLSSTYKQATGLALTFTPDWFTGSSTTPSSSLAVRSRQSSSTSSDWHSFEENGVPLMRLRNGYLSCGTVTVPPFMTDPSYHERFAHDLSTMAKMTNIWVVRKGMTASQIFIRSGYNLESLSGSDMFKAFLSPNTHWLYGWININSVNVGSDWGLDGPGINFPKYVVAQFGLPTAGYKFIVDSFGLQFLKLNQP